MAYSQIRTVSFKVRLIDEDGRQIEVRRFGITVDPDTIISFSLLRSKLQAIFPLLHASFFKVSWKDGEGDEIIISSSEELAEAMAGDEVCKLCVTLVRAEGTNENKVQEETAKAAPTINLHRNVICDVCDCDAEIVGSRFKCLQCDDFDLCRGCEATGIHSEHAMLRIVKPIEAKKAFQFRKFCAIAREMFRDCDQQSSRGPREHNAATNENTQAFMMGKFQEVLEKILSPLDCDLLLYGGDNPEPTVLFSTNNAGGRTASAGESRENSTVPSGSGQANGSAAEPNQKKTTAQAASKASSSSDNGDPAAGASATDPEVAPPSTSSEPQQAEDSQASGGRPTPEQQVSHTEKQPSANVDYCFRTARDPRITPEMMQHMQQMLRDKHATTGQFQSNEPVHPEPSSSSTLSQPQHNPEYSGTSRWDKPTEGTKPVFLTSRPQNVANQASVFNESSYAPMYPILPTPSATSTFGFGAAIPSPPSTVFGFAPVTSASNVGTNFGSCMGRVSSGQTFFGSGPIPPRTSFGQPLFGQTVAAPASSAGSTLAFVAPPVSSSSNFFGHQFGQAEAAPVNITRGPPGASSSLFLPSPAFSFGIGASSVPRGPFSSGNTGFPNVTPGASAAPFIQQIPKAGTDAQGAHMANGAAPTTFGQKAGSTNPFRQQAHQYRTANTQLGNLPEPLIPVPAPVQQRPPEQQQPQQKQVQTPAPASRRLTPEERSEALVWCAVERMVEMGFSNDDGRLFHVLQLVDGNIDRAIERLNNPSCL